MGPRLLVPADDVDDHAGAANVVIDVDRPGRTGAGPAEPDDDEVRNGLAGYPVEIRSSWPGGIPRVDGEVARTRRVGDRHVQHDGGRGHPCRHSRDASLAGDHQLHRLVRSWRRTLPRAIAGVE